MKSGDISLINTMYKEEITYKWVISRPNKKLIALCGSAAERKTSMRSRDIP